MRIGRYSVVALYVLGIVGLIFGCVADDPVEKARSFAWGASMFAAASAIGVLWLMYRESSR
jgi:hypothetical protein